MSTVRIGGIEATSLSINPFSPNAAADSPIIALSANAEDTAFSRSGVAPVRNQQEVLNGNKTFNAASSDDKSS